MLSSLVYWIYSNYAPHSVAAAAAGASPHCSASPAAAGAAEPSHYRSYQYIE